MSSASTYGVVHEAALPQRPVPELPYRPRIPRDLGAGIALIGCGGITQSHLRAYRNGGYRVVALCSRERARAEARRREFFPNAAIATDYREVLARSDVAIVDITTQASVRPPLIEAALRAGKHVLSQKPFVLDLAVGQKLVALSEREGRKLAVNQNGRWAPHFSWMREAIRAGLVGEIATADFFVQWDHHWIVGTNFEEMEHLVLNDFGIHWFDIALAFFAGRPAQKVFASATRSSSQRARPPFLAHACVEFDAGQATFVFNADCPFGQEDRSAVVGSRGTLRSAGPSLTDQRVTLHTAEGVMMPVLEGSWFPDGFQGAMAELMCAVEEDREPENSARNNLATLELCFAAARSAESGLAEQISDATRKRVAIDAAE
jgi:predicted dehydrogenase